MNHQKHLSSDGTILTIHVPFAIEKCGGRKLVLTPDGSPHQSRTAQVDNSLVKAIARAYRWRRMLESGAYPTLQDLAAHEKINKSYLSRVLRLTLLAPSIVEAIMEGRQPPTLQLNDLLKPFPLTWAEQEEMFLR